MISKLSEDKIRYPGMPTKTLSNLSLAILIGLMALLFYLISSLLTQPLDDASSPRAVNGVYTVNQDLSEASASLPLLGQWLFVWDKESMDVRSEPDVVNVGVPHAWDIPNEGLLTLPVVGIASYSLEVVNADTTGQLALQVPPIGSAYRLYIDGRLINSAGVVGRTAETSEPGYNPGVVLFSPESKDFTITLHVSNQDLYWAGIWYPPRLGTPEVLYQEQLKTMLRSGFIIAVLLTIAIFNLIQISIRPKEPLPFIIAFCCLIVALREMETSQILNIANLIELEWDTYIRISFLTFFLASPIFASFYHVSYPKDFHQPVMYSFYIVSGVFSLAVVVFTPDVFGVTMWWYQVTILSYMVYLAWRMFVIVNRRRYGSRLVFLGTALLFVFVINDILNNMGVIRTSFMASFGLVAFVICQTYITMMRFTTAMSENQRLYHSLAERDSKLKAFSSSLEDQISLGEQLQRQNKELENLANRDTLTGLPNRRGMLPHAKRAMLRHQQEQSPFCLLLIDIDSFKQINDTLGHDKGDRVLSESATVMSAVLRDQDVIARWGGEEFLVLLSATSLVGAAILAEKLRARVESEVSERMSHVVTATIGVAEFKEGESFEQIFRRADLAMYKGKQAGRNRVVSADGSEQDNG